MWWDGIGLDWMYLEDTLDSLPASLFSTSSCLGDSEIQEFVLSWVFTFSGIVILGWFWWNLRVWCYGLFWWYLRFGWLWNPLIFVLRECFWINLQFWVIFKSRNCSFSKKRNVHFGWFWNLAIAFVLVVPKEIQIFKSLKSLIRIRIPSCAAHIAIAFVVWREGKVGRAGGAMQGHCTLQRPWVTSSSSSSSWASFRQASFLSFSSSKFCFPILLSLARGRRFGLLIVAFVTPLNGASVRYTVIHLWLRCAAEWKSHAIQSRVFR